MVKERSQTNGSIYGEVESFSFSDFMASIRKSLDPNKLAESLNKRLKRIVKGKERFPNEEALERMVCTSYLEDNVKNEGQRHPGFSKACYEWMPLFE
ncbi:hypothetical protein ABB02_01702 [Clostridiaceae bacterium JG1575]|nr:hypothetical protein ABB02_01702 [Clostridiaceae bacterium JG1575]